MATLFFLSASPNQTYHIKQLHRAHETAIFRLKTHHAPPNGVHLLRSKKEHPAKCVYCPDSDETVDHFLFRCLYDNIISVTMENGVKQGGVLSPTLFCIYFDELLRRLRETDVGCHIGPRTH